MSAPDLYLMDPTPCSVNSADNDRTTSFTPTNLDCSSSKFLLNKYIFYNLLLFNLQITLFFLREIAIAYIELLVLKSLRRLCFHPGLFICSSAGLWKNFTMDFHENVLEGCDMGQE